MQFYTAADLESLELPPLRWAVPELLPAGLTLLAGKPKQGKSWLALALGCAVSRGDRFLGQPAEAGHVLYLALEDTPRRAQDRLDRLRAAGVDAGERLVLAFCWPPLGRGGEDRLRQWLADHPDTRLVIVDTLARVRPPRGRQGDLYLEDYGVIARLKRLADEHDVAFLIVHHLRKQGADDEFDTVSGTTGLTGAADATWVLSRPRGQWDGTLSVISRDVAERKLRLRFDAASCCWHCLGTEEEAPLSNRRQEVLSLLAASGPLYPREVAQHLGIERNAAKVMLHRMAQDGLVDGTNGSYRLAGLVIREPDEEEDL